MATKTKRPKETYANAKAVVAPLEFAHGTTTLSVFQGGIIAAVDSRASLGGLSVRKRSSHQLSYSEPWPETADCSFGFCKLRAKRLHELTGRRMSVRILVSYQMLCTRTEG
jgi:hypothetical protein